MEPAGVTLGTVRLDLQRRILWRDGRATTLGQHACDVLSSLMDAKGAVVSKDALMATAWPGQIVEENALQAQISVLRKALGETGKRCIITVPGSGYRWVGESAATEEAVIAGPNLRGQPAIAVLPFDNLTGDPANEWLADGIADDLIVELSRSRSWTVISRGSSFVYKGVPTDILQVSQDLGVRYVLEGSVRRSSEQLRVAAQLTETEQRSCLWTERYDRGLTDLFAILSEIAQAVSRALEAAVQSAEQSRVLRKGLESLDAWEAWQRSKSAREAWDWENAELLLRRSIELDPGFAPPHAERAFYLCASASAAWLPFHEARAEAEAEALEAIRLDPTDAGGYGVLSLCRGMVRDAASALQMAEHAVELGPSAWLARLCMVTAQMSARRFDDAAQHLEVLRQISPRGINRFTIQVMRAMLHFLRSEYETAAAAAEEVVATHPAYPHTYWMLLASLGHLGRLEKTQTLMSQWHAAAPRLSAQLTERGVSWLSQEDSDRVLLGLRAAGWAG